MRCDVKQTVSISKVDRTNNVAAEVEGAISNTNLTVGYYMRTLGLYAQDPDEGEILYAVTIASQAGYMPPFNGKTTSGAFFRITTTIGNADNLNVQVNPSAVATIGEINDLQKQIDAMKKVDELKIKTIELENNSRTIHLVSHNGTAISDHTSNSLVGLKQIMIVDSTLTNPNGFANAKATGDAINTAYQQLSHAIGLIMAVLDSLDKNQVITDIKNRLSALEDQKKENK